MLRELQEKLFNLHLPTINLFVCEKPSRFIKIGKNRFEFGCYSCLKKLLNNVIHIQVITNFIGKIKMVISQIVLKKEIDINRGPEKNICFYAIDFFLVFNFFFG